VNEPQYKNLYVITLCVSMFIVCIGYVLYGVLPWIPLHSVRVTSAITDTPPLVHYNKGLLYIGLP
jgi:hypothetical protein